jgi:hypothetical protein
MTGMVMNLGAVLTIAAVLGLTIGKAGYVEGNERLHSYLDVSRSSISIQNTI